MNAEAITLVVFFSTLFLLAQIRFFRRLIKLKKRSDNLPGVMFLAGIIGDCCCCEICAIIYGYKRSEEHLIEQAREKALKEKKAKIQQTRKEEELRETDFQSKEEEKRKIIELVSKKQKTSLQWISTIAMIPIETVIEILTKDPNFVIKDDYVLIQKIQAKRESTIPEDRRESPQELREIKKKLAQGICPICNTPFESGHEFCSNCGYLLK